MSSLQLNNVKKTYEETQILHGINLQVDPGEFIVVVGASGCGKSSLLRMVAGLETVSEGEIYIADKLVNQVEPKDRDIAMVFQNYALYPHMTVYKNMAYGLKMRKVDSQEIAKRVTSAAKLLKIEQLLDRKPQALSGGQRQRVAMGRAIVRQPEVFLFDEPLSNLDAKLRMEMRLEIKKLQTRLETTSLYVTHDQVEAMTMADRIMILNKGKVEQIGTPEEIYQQPKTKFVASFMGSGTMNVLPAKLNHKQAIVENGFKLILAELKLEMETGLVNIGIRCEDVDITEHSSLKMTVELIENLGSHCLIHGKVAELTPFTIKYSGERKIILGEQLPITLKQQNLYFFDKHTGQRIN